MAAVLYCSNTLVLAAQTSGTIGVGASIVEYDGFLTSAAATLTPALQFDNDKVSLGAQGGWTVFESGNQIFQFTTAAGWLSALRPRWRVELAGVAGASKYAEEAASGHFLARSRLHFFGDRMGGWLGATTGAAFDTSTVTPVELSIGAWTARGRMTVVGTITTTWLGDDRHLDMTGAARWATPRAELEARIGLRPWVQSGDTPPERSTGLWGEVSVLVPLTPQMSLALSGGDYPSDPVRRVLGATYLTAGFRITLFGARPAPAFVLPAVIAAVRSQNVGSAGSARLEIARGATCCAVRIHVTGASSVEIMGDFTEWQPVAMSLARAGFWEIDRVLAPGVHRLNIRIDGGPWLVPRGARSEADEFGSVVGIVVID